MGFQVEAVADEDLTIAADLCDLVDMPSAHEQPEGPGAFAAIPDLSEDDARGAAHAWYPAADTSLQVLRDASEARRSVSLGHLGHLSLMLVTRDGGQSRAATLVHWLNPQRKIGNLVRMRDGEVISAMPGIRPEEATRSHEHAELVHPDVGCAMRRVSKAHGRPSVPLHIQRLLQMCALAEESGANGDTGASLLPCFICGGDGASAGDDGKETATAQCCICLLGAHQPCIDFILRSDVDKLCKELPPLLPLDFSEVCSLPSCFGACFVCGLCRAEVLNATPLAVSAPSISEDVEGSDESDEGDQDEAPEGGEGCDD